MQSLRGAPKLGREQRLGEDVAHGGRQVARDGQREDGQDGQSLCEISSNLISCHANERRAVRRFLVTATSEPKCSAARKAGCVKTCSKAQNQHQLPFRPAAATHAKSRQITASMYHAREPESHHEPRKCCELCEQTKVLTHMQHHIEEKLERPNRGETSVLGDELVKRLRAGGGREEARIILSLRAFFLIIHAQQERINRVYDVPVRRVRATRKTVEVRQKGRTNIVFGAEKSAVSPVRHLDRRPDF